MRARIEGEANRRIWGRRKAQLSFVLWGWCAKSGLHGMGSGMGMEHGQGN